MLGLRPIQPHGRIMQKNNGFSLVEVLISLFLATSITLLLLKEQWQCNQLLRQAIQQLIKCSESDNNSELQVAGYSLIELLIAIFLSSLLMIGLTQHFIQIKTQQKITDEYFKQEADREWIADLIKISVHNAGYTPCLPLNQLITFDGRNKAENILGLVVTENSIKTM